MIYNYMCLTRPNSFNSVFILLVADESWYKYMEIA